MRPSPIPPLTESWLTVTTPLPTLDRELHETPGKDLPHDPEYRITRIIGKPQFIANTFGGHDAEKTVTLLRVEVEKKKPARKRS